MITYRAHCCIHYVNIVRSIIIYLFNKHASMHSADPSPGAIYEMKTRGFNAAANYQFGQPTTTMTVGRCGKLCNMNPICQSMTYDNSTQLCQINNVVLSKAQATAVVATNSVLWFDRLDY
jgi:hypothetical protein